MYRSNKVWFEETLNLALQNEIRKVDDFIT